MRKKYVIGFALIIAVSLLMPVFHAHALSTDDGPAPKIEWNPFENIKKTLDFLSDPSGKITETITEGFLKPFTFFAMLLKVLVSLLFAFSAYVFGIVLNLNFNILQPTSPTYIFITTGWGIVRDVTNLGFVLFIILIALATIVRYQDYEAKRLLPRLIGAAILVNFSLAIPTVFINFSNIVSNYFLRFEEVKGCDVLKDELLVRTCSLTMHMGSVLEPQKFVIEPEFTENEIASILGKADAGIMRAVMATTSQYLGVMFLALGVFVMVCYAILFLIRFIAFHFLLILAPITWLFWVIPQTKNLFSKWWTKFTQYVFFAPAALFFLYLVIYTKKGMNSVTANIDPTPYLGFTQYKFDMFLEMTKAGVMTFVMFAFLVGGLLAAQSLSIHGASGMVNFGKNTGKKAKQWAQRKTTEGKKAAVGSRTSMQLATRLQESKNPLLKAVGNRWQNKSFKADQEIQKKKTDLMRGATRGFEEDRLGAAYEGALFGRERRAILEETAKVGGSLFSDLNKKKFAVKEAREYRNESYEKWGNARKDYGEAEKNLNLIPKRRKELEKEEKDALDAHQKIKPKTDAKEDDKKDWETKFSEIKNSFESKRFSLKEEERDAVQILKEARKHKEDTTAQYRNSLISLYKAKREQNEKQSAYDDFVDNSVSKFDPDTMIKLKKSGFRLERTDLPGGREAREKQIPELNVDNFRKEVNRLETTYKKAEEEFKKTEANPFSKKEEISLKRKEFEYTKSIYETNKKQFEDFKKAKENKDIAEILASKITSRSHPDFELAWNKLREAENKYLEVSKKNLTRKQAYKTGGKEEKTIEE